MKKNLGKSIDLKDLKNSPWTIAVILILVIALLITVIAFLVKDILKTKNEIITARETLAGNVTELASLEELRAKSEEAEEKLKYYEGILPEKLDDVYILEEKLSKLCKKYGLMITSFGEASQTQSTVVETTFTFTVEGEYKDIVSLMKYMSDSKQIRRVDGLTLSTGENGYSANFTVTYLSQNGASGIATEGAVMEEVAEAVSEVAAEVEGETAAAE